MDRDINFRISTINDLQNFMIREKIKNYKYEIVKNGEDIELHIVVDSNIDKAKLNERLNKMCVKTLKIKVL